MAERTVWFSTGVSRGFGTEITRNALARGDRVVATARSHGSVTEAFGEHAELPAVKLDVQSLMKKVTAAWNDDFSRRIGPEMPASLSIELEGGEVIRGEKGVFDGFWATPMTWDAPLA